MGLTFSGDPEPTSVPPHEPVYHFHTALVPNEPPITLRFADPPGQKLLASADAEAGALEGMQQAVTEIECDTDEVLL